MTVSEILKCQDFLEVYDNVMNDIKLKDKTEKEKEELIIKLSRRKYKIRDILG